MSKHRTLPPSSGMYRRDVELPNIWSAPCGREGWGEWRSKVGRGGAVGVRSRAHVGVMYVYKVLGKPFLPVRSSVVSERKNNPQLNRCSFGSSGQTANQSPCLSFTRNPAPTRAFFFSLQFTHRSLSPLPSSGERGTSGRRVSAG